MQSGGTRQVSIFAIAARVSPTYSGDMRCVSLVILSSFLLAGCAWFPGETSRPQSGVDSPPGGSSGQIRPQTRPGGLAPPPPAGARTAEEFDTTSVEERAAAVADAGTARPGRDLGVTIASLGAVTEPGIWMKTPLVSSPSKGRVEYPAKGTSVAVDLIPRDGEPGGGSQLSLAAMRLLEAGLTDLPEVRVYRLAN